MTVKLNRPMGAMRHRAMELVSIFPALKSESGANRSSAFDSDFALTRERARVCP